MASLNSFRYSILNVSVHTGFECLWIKFFLGNSTVVVGVIYKPPQLDASLFVEVFEDMVSELMVILGDFNINFLY